MSRLRAGLIELFLIAGLYVAYDGSRTLANDNVVRALARARELLHLEDGLGLAWEQATNAWLAAHDLLGVIASFWYSSAHYVVTAGVLIWLYTRGRAVYLPARRALAATTLLGLACYLLMPTAPPRMLAGYIDVLRLHANVGWWGADASAPRGLGGFTNQLAAFPSLHAGWSLWVAFAVTSATRGSGVRGTIARVLAWAYAATTAVVVIGTANHWTLDVIVGWTVTIVGWVSTRWLARLAGDAGVRWRVGRIVRTAARTAVGAAETAGSVAARVVTTSGVAFPGMAVPVVVRVLADDDRSRVSDVGSP